MAIKWTKTALGPIDEIAGFIAKDNPTRASSFLLELQDAVTKLQPHPGMAELAGSRAHVSWCCTKTTSPFSARVAMMSKS